MNPEGSLRRQLSAALAVGPRRARLRIASTGTLVADDLRVTADSAARRQGLTGLGGLPDTAALIVAPTQGIHTFGMRFPIDVVFVDRRGAVLKICPAVPPARVRLALRAFAAVELSAGRSSAVELAVGDTLEVVTDSTP